LAKALFVEGREASSVAADLGISRPELLKRTSAIAKQVSASLRHRTIVPKTQPTSGEKEMPAATVDLPVLFREFKSGNLGFTRDDEGRVLVTGELLRNPLPVESLREQLIEQSSEMSIFESELEEVVAQIFAPEAKEDRSDVSPDQKQWLEMLSRAERASRQEAGLLVSLWTREAKRNGVTIDSEQLDHAEERIRDSLATVSASLVESMPRRLRRTGSAVLWLVLGNTPSEARFSWDGEFKGEPLDLLATCIVQSLSNGHSYLPDFDWTVSRIQGSVRLEWSRPVAQRARD